MIVLKNGMAITPQGPRNADLALENGKIAAIAPALTAGPGDTVLDAAGCYVCPGFIDGHTHLDLDTGAARTADDFESGTRAAVCGGTTTVVDFATQDKGGTLMAALDAWQARAAGVSRANYAFHMAITDWNERTRAELPALRKAGVCSFKVYLAYDAMRVDDAQLLEILESLKPIGGILGVHCENGTLVDELQKRELAAGRTTPASHPVSRPPEVEAEAIARLCWVAKLADAPVHVVHLSTALGLAEVRAARRRGQTVYAETCPQYLLLDESRYHLPGFESAKYVMSPPLRSPQDVAALRRAVEDGEINTVSTDHCSFRYATQKTLGRQDFTKIPNGAPGIEHRPALMFTSFAGRIAPEQLCRLMSENTARLFGMYPRKGALCVGSDADVTVWDPAERWTIRAAEQQQKVDYTPYEGMDMTGRARWVFVNGILAAENGRPTKEIAGQYVRR
jgi:dihydropyrimidinase